MTGVVRVEGTNEPLRGVKLQILVGGMFGREEVAETDGNGRFAIDVPAGDIRVRLIEPPAGYVPPNVREVMEDLVVGPDRPVIHREYHVQREPSGT